MSLSACDNKMILVESTFASLCAKCLQLLGRTIFTQLAVITPGYIEELDDEGRLGDNNYLHYEVTDEERDGMGEMCDPYEDL